MIIHNTCPLSRSEYISACIAIYFNSTTKKSSFTIYLELRIVRINMVCCAAIALCCLLASEGKFTAHPLSAYGLTLLALWLFMSIFTGCHHKYFPLALPHVCRCWHKWSTVIWLYFSLKIFCTLLFRAVLISYAPHVIYETRVKVSLLKNIRAFNFRTDGSVRN